MKRMVMGLYLVKRTKSTTSLVSFKPLITTTLILTLCTPRAKALSMQSITASWPLLRVMNSNLKGSSVSSDTLRCVSPFCTRVSSFLLPSAIPLVVIPICSNPCGLSAASEETS